MLSHLQFIGVVVVLCQTALVGVQLLGCPLLLGILAFGVVKAADCLRHGVGQIVEQSFKRVVNVGNAHRLDRALPVDGSA